MIRMDRIKIKEDSYQNLIRMLKSETNLNFEYYRRNFIERRIKARMIRVNTETIDSYCKYFLLNPSELNKFLDSFHINYSYLFRNWDIFERFQDFFLRCLNYRKERIIGGLKPDPSKALVSKKRLKKERVLKKNSISEHLVENQEFANQFLEYTSLYRKINRLNPLKSDVYIWSCPCASGEEPYSIAMIIDNLKKQIPHFPTCRLTASDIDSIAIEKAKTGIYDELSMRETSKYYTDKYFTKKKDIFGYKYKIDENIKNSVEFLEEDVTNGHMKTWKYDIIFCRYLLIYFNRKNRENFLRIIESRLNEGGLLFLGKTETLFNSHRCLKLVDSKNHIYMKSY